MPRMIKSMVKCLLNGDIASFTNDQLSKPRGLECLALHARNCTTTTNGTKKKHTAISLF